jgi:hypothetical protein
MNEISNIWIPAFAGMTTQMFSGFSSNPLGLPPRDIDPRQGRIAAKG